MVSGVLGIVTVLGLGFATFAVVSFSEMKKVRLKEGGLILFPPPPDCRPPSTV